MRPDAVVSSTSNPPANVSSEGKLVHMVMEAMVCDAWRSTGVAQGRGASDPGEEKVAPSRSVAVIGWLTSLLMIAGVVAFSQRR
jgi:hypothetical protein